MDSALLGVLCFALALVLGYFFGRITGIRPRD